MDNIFIQLAIILGLASVLGFITHKFKLPLLIAYLIGGLIIAIIGIFDIKTSAALSFLPEIGIAFVLFLVGMELDLRQLKSLGTPIIVSGLLQIVITSILGTFIAQSFNFSLVESIYLGIGLSFSSTIVVVKLLIEKNTLDSLYGKLSVGILLLEDLLAVVILLGLTSFNSSIFHLGLTELFPLLSFAGKVVILLSFAILLSKYILGSLFKAVSSSGELLFLTALAWCFIYITFAQSLGFSVLIGAFLAGVALANSPYHFQIQGKVKPMRDFFVALFFVYLGTRVDFSQIQSTFLLILVFTTYAVIFKPVLFLLILGSFGFKKHPLFQTAINLSQISEFSLIILLVGLSEGIVSQSALTVIAASGVLSIIISSVVISKSNRLYKQLAFLISFFERGERHLVEGVDTKTLEDHVVLLGSHNVGAQLIRFFRRERIPFIVLDFNPYQVEKLAKEGIPVVFGDMGDPEVLDFLNLHKAILIISTVPDIHDNKLLIEDLKNMRLGIPIIVRAESLEEAKDLYKFGASFVYIPDIVSGEFLVQTLKDHMKDREYFKERPRIELEKLSHQI
ncbi:cation:proton antiporter [Candidatus Daviesbacteria bacterium]|nr:cation:proton antiporter [Candidatus Daviesbacteria bacterium]